jgi:hypothetical protein
MFGHLDVDVAKVCLSVFVSIDVVDAHGRASSQRLDHTIVAGEYRARQGPLLALRVILHRQASSVANGA